MNLIELIRGAEAAFANAEELCLEAKKLRESGHFARALFLHQISLEECGKVELLGGWITGALMGLELNYEKLGKALANHRAKNSANAYMLEPNEKEIAARKRKDWKGAIEAFDRAKRDFHEKSNAASFIRRLDS